MTKFFRAALAAMLVAATMVCLIGCDKEEYKPELKSPSLTTPAIGQAGVLRVGVNTSKSPLAGMGNSKIIGIDVDIAAALADELGLAVDVVDVGSDPAQALSSDTVDIVMGIDDSDSKPEFWLSKEYLETGVAVFALAEKGASVPTADDGKTIAAQVSSKSAWAVTNEFGESRLKSESDLTTALDDIAQGSADYLASDAVIGMYAANRQGLDVEIVALMDAASGYCIGVSSENVQLQNAIQNALDTILQNGTVGVIEQKWLGGELNLSNTPKTEGLKAAAEAAAAEAAAAEDTEGEAAAAA